MAKIKVEVDTEDQQGGYQFRPAAGNRIGVVSSIEIPATLRTRFEKGVNDPTVDVKYKERSGYKRNNIQKLEQNVKSFNASADLIVTVGGSVAFEAARTEASKSFLSLVGVDPDIPPGLFKGGVSLASVNANRERFDILRPKVAADTEIGLFCNRNSAMHDKEVDDWNFQVGNGQIFMGGVDANGDNDSAAFATDFLPAKIPNTIKALVISADPFFQESKELLIAAVNSWLAAAQGRFVCYPALEYANRAGANKPTATKSFLYGPDLASAYFLLGQLAVAVLKSNGSVPLLQAGNIRVDL